MNIDIMMKNARNTHLQEFSNSIIEIFRKRMDMLISTRNELAKEDSKKYSDVIFGINSRLDELLIVWDAVQAYAKLEKR